VGAAELPVLPLPDKPSIAVLPFANMSGDPEQEYFADGMVEEIITALSRIRWLFVIARNSSFTYKGQAVDVKQVGRELGVRYVLEGSVRKGGNRLRITAQLIDAQSGAHLWADRFDGSLEDVFRLQDEVASSVAGVIEPTLEAAETARSANRPTNDLTAYDDYLRAYAMAQSSKARVPDALRLLEQAIERDPHYGPALAWAAFCYMRACQDGRSEDAVADSRKAIDLAQRALQVAGDDPGTLTNAVPSVSQTVTSSTPCASPNNAQGTLKALEQVGLVHMLAEPNLTAVSGETAKFLAGGEFPVPNSRDRDGNVTVSFKQFGVGLSFTPVVLAPGRISLQLSSEVSELTNTGSFLVGNGSNGLSIPALSVRRTETTVELPSGGSFAVAGLMQHNTKQVIDGFPGVKDLPVLGALFRSRDFADDQTELVVLISAYLVEPKTESAFVSPTDGFVAPTDPETLLLGRLNAVYKKKDEKPMSPQASAPVGFVVR